MRCGAAGGLAGIDHALAVGVTGAEGAEPPQELGLRVDHLLYLGLLPAHLVVGCLGLCRAARQAQQNILFHIVNDSALSL
ncbi:hypothetical protein GCM10023096_28270 [Nonomuraea ferruginea]